MRQAITMAQVLEQMESRIRQRLLAECDASLWKIPVFGEFSSGKTRLIRQLLGERIPAALRPISSQQTETAIPLWVTYGPQPELRLMEAHEPEARPIRTWHSFPTSEELMECGVTSERYWLSLALPIEELVLGEDGIAERPDRPLRISLIDTPGWNAEDRDFNPAQLFDEFTLAAVYVVKSSRVDSQRNQDKLRRLLIELNEGYGDRLNVSVYVTECPEAEAVSIRSKLHARMERILAEEQLERLTYDICCVELNELDENARERLEHQFWSGLFTHFAMRRSLTPNFERALGGWGIKAGLGNLFNQIKKADLILRNFCIEGTYIPRMNMTRLAGLDQEQRFEKLWSAWQKSLGVDVLPEGDDWPLESLPEDHPLAPWWNEALLRRVRPGLDGVAQLLNQGRRAIRRLDPAENNLNNYLAENLDEPLEWAQMIFAQAKALFPDSLLAHWEDKTDAQLLATMLAITLCGETIKWRIGAEEGSASSLTGRSALTVGRLCR